VGFCRSRKEVFANLFEKVKRGYRNSLRKRFNFLIKFLEFVGQYRLKDSLHLFIGGESKVDQSEFRLDSLGNLSSTSSWGSHGCQKLDINQVLEKVSGGSVKPSSIIHPLSDQFQRRLTSKGIFSGHI